MFLIGAFLSGCDPTCDPGSLVAPELRSPDWREVVDGAAVELEWSYPDSRCQPEEYRIRLFSDRDQNEHVLTQHVDGSKHVWNPSTPLDDAEEFWWQVAAKVGSTVGPWSSDRLSFITGPICDPGDLVAPTLVLPTEGRIFNRVADFLEWEWPLTTCIPESYKVEVSKDPDLGDTTYFGSIGTPGTRWGFGSMPPGATQFWWRIAAYTEGVLGPYSTVSTFYTDPACDAVGDLAAPILLSPKEGEVVTTNTPLFDWSYADACAPTGYDFGVSTEYSMRPFLIEDAVSGYALTSFQLETTLDDCRTYYWQTAMEADLSSGPLSEIGEFSVNISGSCGCDPGDIPIPEFADPTLGAVVPGLRPSLDWHNPGNCTPDSYLINLANDPYFSNSDLNGEVSMPGITAYSPPVDLEPATQYWWEVVGKTGSTVGDYFRSVFFFTGPECISLAEVAAPERIFPSDGEVVDTLDPTLHFLPGSACIPEGWSINLQVDPFFGGPNLMGDSTFPSFYRVTPTLTDCTLYFWKVMAIETAEFGPETDTGWFYTDVSGTCPSAPTPGTAKSNIFCRGGTYQEYWPYAKHIFYEGDPVWVIAQNLFSTYYEVVIPGEDKFTPLQPYQTCWMIKDGVKLWTEVPDLLIAYPPPTPTPVPLICNVNLEKEDCEASGGTYFTQNQTCQCP